MLYQIKQKNRHLTHAPDFSVGTNTIIWFVLDCPELNLPDLADAVVCHMMDTCVGVECCPNVGLIDHSLNAFIILDSCNSKLEIGIEQFKFELDFDSYILETKETFSLENIVFIE